MGHFDYTVHLGDVMTFVAVVVGLYLKSRRDEVHFQEVKDKASAQHAELQTKVNIMYTWFENHVLDGGGSFKNPPPTKV